MIHYKKGENRHFSSEQALYLIRLNSKGRVTTKIKLNIHHI